MPIRNRMAWRPRLLIVLTAGGAATATVLAFALPSVQYSYRSPSLHVAIETTTALIALFAAYLVFGRFRVSALLSDLVLVAALTLFAFTNLFFLALPLAIPSAYSDTGATWTSVIGTLLAGAAFAVGGFASERRLRNPARSAGFGVAVCIWVVTGAGVCTALFLDDTSAGLPAWLSPESADRPLLVGNPVVLTAQLVGVVLFGAAAFGFLRRAERGRDELMQWFGAGATFAAFASLNYLFFPSLYSEWVYTGDFLRLGFYLLVLVGAGREIQMYWHRLADAAVLEDRRRIARDLHDGLAQELAFIAAEASGQAAKAAERALDESRRAIAALTRRVDEPLDVALLQAAEEVAHRVGTQVRFDGERIPDVPGETREALIRIVREAVTNAARHGRAERVRIELANGDGLRLRIADDGSGFRPGATRPGGFGLVSMRERAEALGGSFQVESEPGAGTAIEVVVP
jgi:signal transduction histidine kinase